MKQILLTLALLGLLRAAPTLHAQHGHLNAGALGTSQNDKLYFANGDIFAASSGYVKDLTFANTGPYAGYYEGGISLTALPQTIANGGPVPTTPAFGSFIQVRLESVSGPAGGTFSLWEDDATSPTISLSVGSSTPSAMWPLSDASLGAGTAGADPFGHLHGRTFTADAAGTYTVGFKLFDTSANGVGGGPIHASSDTFLLSFQTIPEPSTLALLGVGMVGLGVLARRQRGARRDEAVK